MIKVLVTGASGFVGSAVAQALLKEGFDVHVLSRPHSPRKHLDVLGVRVHQGDLLHKDTLKVAMEGSRYVFHVAAHYKLFNRPVDLPYRINVDGTRNVLEAAQQQGVERIVYTSSVSTVGICEKRGIGDETTPLDPQYVVGHYKRSKVLAEEETLRWVREHNLPVVIVNPAAPIGHGDIKPTPTGRIVLNFLKGKMHGYLDTGLNVIDVEDVAAGHVLALRKGRVGERYILGHRNMMLLEIFHMMESISGIPAPRWKVPYALAFAAGVVGETISRITGKDPVASVDAVRMAKKKMFFDSSKAIRELGLPQSSIRVAFEKAVKWFYEQGYIQKQTHFRMSEHEVSRNGGVHEAKITR